MEAIFRGEGNQQFSLRIDRYESPDGDTYDANWLYMKGQVTSNEENWEFLDPCLMAYEYQFLAEWLRTIESPGSPLGLRFIEHNLMFYKEMVGNHPALVVEFQLECAPPSVKREGWKYDKTKLYPYVEWTKIYPFHLNDFQAIADAIELQLKQFPVRKPDGFNNHGPSYEDRRVRHWVCAVKGTDGRYVFVTNDKDHLDDFFFETLGRETYTRDDYDIIEYKVIKKNGLLKPGEIVLLEEEGKVELWDTD